MRKTVCALLALLILLSTAQGIAAAEEKTVELPDFMSFTWDRATLSAKEENASYCLYGWSVAAEITKEIAAEYLSLLEEKFDLQQLAMEEDTDSGDFSAAWSMPDCEELGFRTSVGGQSVKGCHVLWLWQGDKVHSGEGTLYLYLSRGISLGETGDHSRLLPSPTPKPSPTPVQKPAQTAVPKVTPTPAQNVHQSNVCPMCHGTKTRVCNTCSGKGYVEVRHKSPGYGGVGTGGSGSERLPCGNPFCHNGQVECMFCNGTGYVY